MTKRQYIGAGTFGGALLVMLYAVPALAEQRDLIPAIVLGIMCLIVMAGCVLFGDLTEITPDEKHKERNLP